MKFFAALLTLTAADKFQYENCIEFWKNHDPVDKWGRFNIVPEVECARFVDWMMLTELNSD